MGQVTEKFQEAKAWYNSKTIIGLIVSSISGVVLALTEGSVDIAGAIGALFDGGEEVSASVDSLIASATFAFGQVLAVYGRLKAKVGLK